MLFNSIEFLLFLPIVLALYWFGTRRNIRVQNILLVLASYFFSHQLMYTFAEAKKYWKNVNG